ncbi:hypothetical protein NOCARDAX2BIS_640005 [Nocardioides sp. AX2bis]|nr:hypothetical protein NOCARDAX2BIS_640005 [Nocardioides sp. AX2bis]
MPAEHRDAAVQQSVAARAGHAGHPLVGGRGRRRQGQQAVTGRLHRQRADEDPGGRGATDEDGPDGEPEGGEQQGGTGADRVAGRAGVGEYRAEPADEPQGARAHGVRRDHGGSLRP